MFRNDFDYLEDILDAARLVQAFVRDVTEEDFVTDVMRQSAVVRQLEIIGEATKRLSHEFRNSHTEIPWKRMAGMRDVLIHAYQRVDVEEVWLTATSFVPELVK